MGRCHEEVLHPVLLLGAHPLQSTSSTPLGTVGVDLGPFHVTLARDRDDHLFVRDEILHLQGRGVPDDLASPIVAVLLVERHELLGEDRHPAIAALQNPLEILDRDTQGGELAVEFFHFQPGEPGQPHVQDGLRLALRQLEGFLQALRRDLGVPRAPDHLDHLVDIVDRDLETLENVGSLVGLLEVERCAAYDHNVTVLDEVLQHLPERKNARHAVDEGQQNRAEGRLHLRMFVQPVQDDLRNGVPLELDYDAEPVSVGFVTHVTDFGQLLVPHELRDLLHEAGLVDHERDLRHHDALGVLIKILDHGAGAHDDPAPAGSVGIFDARPATDEPTRRKVRPGHELLEALLRELGILDQRRRSREDLPKIMGRNVGRHSHGDPRTTVDEQVRHLSREHGRFFQAPIEVGREGDRLLFDVLEKLHRKSGQASLGVSVRRRRISVDGSEIPLAVDEWITQREILDHPDHGVVHGGVAVGVVLSQDVADHRGRFLVTPPGAEPELAHRIQDAPVNRLQAIAYVGERSLYDDAHRVVDERLAHLVL